MGKVIYLCPVTKKGYRDPRMVRLNYLQNQWELTPDEIFEYCDLKDQLEEEELLEENA